MIFNFDTEMFRINDLIGDRIFQSLEKKPSKADFQLDKLHEFIAPAEKANLLQSVYSLFRERAFQNDYDNGRTIITIKKA